MDNMYHLQVIVVFSLVTQWILHIIPAFSGLYSK